MAAFDEVLAQLREGIAGVEAPVPTQLFDDLAGEYQRLVDQRDGATVTLTEREQALAEKDREISRLKGENYDLASRIGFKTEEPKNDDPPEKPRGIEGLFQRRRKL